MVRNMTLPARTRAMAQLELTQMHAYTRPTQIKNRCIMGTKGRGILRDFKMSRVRAGPGELCALNIQLTRSQYAFRVNALAGNLPGVKKASW